jgi:4-aminobutyrate---pyruvate transaminase
MLDESRKIGAFAHGFTYGGHPLAAAIGLKALEIYERDDIVGKVRALIPRFQTRLVQDEGLITRTIGDTLAFCPPLIITEAEIDEMFDRFERGLNRAETMVAAEGLRNQ